MKIQIKSRAVKDGFECVVCIIDAAFHDESDEFDCSVVRLYEEK